MHSPCSKAAGRQAHPALAEAQCSAGSEISGCEIAGDVRTGYVRNRIRPSALGDIWVFEENMYLDGYAAVRVHKASGQ
jgi:hypothetical protein